MTQQDGSTAAEGEKIIPAFQVQSSVDMYEILYQQTSFLDDEETLHRRPCLP